MFEKLINKVDILTEGKEYNFSDEFKNKNEDNKKVVSTIDKLKEIIGRLKSGNASLDELEDALKQEKKH